MKKIFIVLLFVILTPSLYSNDEIYEHEILIE